MMDKLYEFESIPQSEMTNIIIRLTKNYYRRTLINKLRLVSIRT